MQSPPLPSKRTESSSPQTNRLATPDAQIYVWVAGGLSLEKEYVMRKNTKNIQGEGLGCREDIGFTVHGGGSGGVQRASGGGSTCIDSRAGATKLNGGGSRC